jgi:hypothetical protein
MTVSGLTSRTAPRRLRKPRQRGDQPSVETAEPRALHSTPDYDELLAEKGILGDENHTRHHESEHQVEEEAKDGRRVGLTPLPTTSGPAAAAEA